MNDSSLWIILQRMRLPFFVIVITYTIAITGLVLIPGMDDNGNVYNMSIFDAFYFVTYTATTIGFGEIPYPFTHYQKMWVSASIYLTVLGWFYGIGTLVSLLQDKLFISEIAIARFQRSVRNMKEDFVIVLGYNETTSEIIKRMLAAKMRVVVIEKDQAKADYLMLEGFVPHVPVLVKDAHNPLSLQYAGITSKYCKSIISLSRIDVLNLRMTLSSKLLNPNIKVVVKASTKEESDNLIDAGADVVDNPFMIISYQLEMALKAPSLFKLENWLYKTANLESKTFSIPDNNIIICGYGRLGSTLCTMFHKNHIYPTVIETNISRVEVASYNKVDVVHGNADDHLYLDKVNVLDAKLIIIATDNDTTNLSILSTIKKLKSKALIVARENEITDYSIFSHANIDHLYIPAQILIHKTTNAISNPLNDKFIRIITKKNELWGQKLLTTLVKNIGIDPITFEQKKKKNEAYQIYKFLENPNNTINLGVLKLSRRDRNQENNLIPLYIKRNDKEIVLPRDSIEVKIGDKILFACDENAKEDLEYVANNAFEFDYIVTGREKKSFLKF